MQAVPLTPSSTVTPRGSPRDSRLVAILGVCPVAVLADSLAAGLALGLGTLLASCAAGAVLARGWRADPVVRLSAVLLVVAAAATVVPVLCKAFFPGFSTLGGASVVLIIANAALPATLVTAAEAPAGVALKEGMRHGAMTAVLLIVIGSLRQWSGPIVAAMPAGAFFSLAVLTAAVRRS